MTDLNESFACVGYIRTLIALIIYIIYSIYG